MYAMRVTEALTHHEYWGDPRFEKKRPCLRGTHKHAAGDNIYHWDEQSKKWRQTDSYHSKSDGSMHLDHVARDTGVDRVLVSTDYVYFGGEGPEIPSRLETVHGENVVKQGQGMKITQNQGLIGDFVTWLDGLERVGYAGAPTDRILNR